MCTPQVKGVGNGGEGKRDAGKGKGARAVVGTYLGVYVVFSTCS